MSRYELWLTDTRGASLALLDTALWLTYSRVANGYGTFSLGLPASFDDRLIKLDHMVQVWRAYDGGVLVLQRVYFIRWWEYRTVDTVDMFIIGGPCTNYLLDGRIVAYAAASAQAAKSDYADDMIKEMVDENLVNDASSPDYGSRDLARLSVETDISGGESLDKGVARRNLLMAVQEIALASAEAGTALYVDIRPTIVQGTGFALMLVTRTGQPGRDRTGNGVLFDQKRGNLVDPNLRQDHMSEINYVYTLGEGTEGSRNVQEVYDAARIAASPWNRREAAVQATYGRTTDSSIQDEGRARLEQGRPAETFRANIMDVEDIRYGRDWGWGDRVLAEYRGRSFECVIPTVAVYVRGDGRETIGATLEAVT